MSLNMVVRGTLQRVTMRSPGLTHLFIRRSSNAVRYGALSSVKDIPAEGQAPKLSFINRALTRLGFQPLTRAPRASLNVTATRLYVCCTQYTDHELFRQEFGLPDTFASWCSILQLHTWMLMVRLENHGGVETDFKFVKRQLNKQMWIDITKRVSKLASGSTKREGLAALGTNYEVSVLGYDEGLFTDDKRLAAALWRNTLSQSKDVDPEHLFLLVDYIHRNLNHLERISDSQIMSGYVTFLPLHADTVDNDKDKRIHRMVSAL